MSSGYWKYTDEATYLSMFIHKQGVFFFCIHTLFCLFGRGFLSVYSTQMFPLSHAGVRDRPYLPLLMLSISLVFFLYLLFSSSLSSPGLYQQTTIPSFLTLSCGTAGDLWPLSCCLQEPLLHKCQTVKLNITYHVSPIVLHFSSQI